MPNPQKEKTVNDFVQLLDQYPIIAAVDVEHLPARTFQIMRAKLRGTALIKMTKRRLLKIALDKSKKKEITKI